MHLLACKCAGPFHCQNGQYLKQMVLHHVLEGSAGIVIAAAVFHPHVLQRGDFHCFDHFPVPGICEDRVGKTDCLYVSYHFFAEIMVDAVDVFRAKARFQLAV